jgi:carboxyl-terminal processing protease
MSQPRFGRALLGSVIGLTLACGMFAGGLTVGLLVPRDSWLPAWASGLSSISTASEPVGTDPTSTTQLFQPFWQAWEIVHESYVDQPVDDTLLMQGAIRGMMDGLGDENSSYMDPDQYRQANVPLEGGYEGIGAWVDTDGEYLTIVATMPDSPAERAGLRPGDEIVAIDGEDMTGIDPNLALRQVLGPAGTTVQLSLRREGESDRLDVAIERARIVVPSLQSEMLERDVAYVHLLTFGGQTTEDLRAALRELLAQDPQGLILDLRGNAGGLLTTGIEVASEFIPDGVVMLETYGDGRERTYTAERGGLATDIPLVVLIDGGSASASEIVAGAIQDRQRGLLVGETSFGKGSVQNWIALQDEAGAIRVTVARWLTPGGRQISQIGLTPDVEVEMTEDDHTAGRDPQLDRAVEVLLQGLQALATQ